jgi:hypothetical protein
MRMISKTIFDLKFLVVQLQTDISPCIARDGWGEISFIPPTLPSYLSLITTFAYTEL